MSYYLSLGNVNVLTPTGLIEDEVFTCEDAIKGCRPQYVFSVPGQVGFRLVLNHLRDCGTRPCRSLRKTVCNSLEDKLGEIVRDGKQLGCLRAQTMIYGSNKICMPRREFPDLAHHLSYCTDERCAQLRRAVLLTVRNRMHEEKVELLAGKTF